MIVNGLLALAVLEIFPPFIIIILPVFFRSRELHGDGVHAMSGVGGGQVLSNKHVTQMATAVGTLDFGSRSVLFRLSVDGSRNLLIK